MNRAKRDETPGGVTSKVAGARPRLLMLIAEDHYFWSHRRPVAEAALAAGYEVFVVTHVGQHVGRIRGIGAQLWPIGLERGSMAPAVELATISEVVQAYRAIRPDIVHHVSFKPIVYGTMASQLAGRPVMVQALTGLGVVFSKAAPAAPGVRALVTGGCRAAFSSAKSTVLVQNVDDGRAAVERFGVDPGRVVCIPGAGVDLARFTVSAECSGPPLVVLPGRMLRTKGVIELVLAAEQLVHEGVRARFALVGAPDAHNPASIPEAELRAWERRGAIEWWGYRDDMRSVFSMSHIVCLPSHGEGCPKALQEAAACGRPIVTTDVPGCRGIVRHGDNGLLVPPGDPRRLAAALRELIERPALRMQMGARGRARAEAELSEGAIAGATVRLYERLLAARRERASPRYCRMA